ncbi:hypothetical protein ACR8AL_07565 [Clavibacter sepedonicus]|nr:MULTISPECIES: hypothetical protein [Clavibacter]MBD5382610.1 hypothetical protein [Clavibacter sp.]
MYARPAPLEQLQRGAHPASAVHRARRRRAHPAPHGHPAAPSTSGSAASS